MICEEKYEELIFLFLGEWRNELKNGFGTLFYPNGFKLYEGENKFL